MAILMFFLGAILGSFYLVIGTRLPKSEDVIFSRSKCDHCGVTLKWYNLIPLFSYVFQKGRCTNCHKKISSDHLWVELITGLLFVMTYFYFKSGYNFYAGLVITSLMIVIFISDFKYMIILDSPLVVSSILIIILKLIYFGGKATLVSILSGAFMFLFMLLIAKVGMLVLKKESLGGGDIKFAFLLGLCLDFKLAIIALVLSTFVALPYALTSVYLKNNHEFPYGPFLTGALFIVFFHYDKFLHFAEFIFPLF